MSLSKILTVRLNDKVLNMGNISDFCPISPDSMWISEIVNNGQSKLRLIKHNTVVTTVQVIGVITGLCLSKKENKLYACFKDNTFKEINTRTETTTTKINDFGFPLDFPSFTHDNQVLVAPRGIHRIRKYSLMNKISGVNLFHISKKLERYDVWDISECPISANVAINCHDKIIVLKSCLHIEAYIYEGEANMLGNFHALSSTFNQNGNLIVSTCYDNSLHVVTIGPGNTRTIVKKFLDCIPQEIKMWNDYMWLQCSDSIDTFQVFITTEDLEPKSTGKKTVKE